MTIKVVNKGWSGLNDEMCSEDVANVTCPALVLAGTTQASTFDLSHIIDAANRFWGMTHPLTSLFGLRFSRKVGHLKR